MLLDAVGGRLPFAIYNNVIGVVLGEDAVPVGFVLSVEVELVHACEVAYHLIVCHDRGLLLRSARHAGSYSS